MTSHRPAAVGTGTETAKETVTGRGTVILTAIKTETEIAKGTATETERAEGTVTRIGTAKEEILVAPGEGAVMATTGSLRKGAMVMSRSRSRDRKAAEPFARSLGGPMNADHEEAVEFAKISKRENRVYVGNLSYDVKYRDLMEFMRGGRGRERAYWPVIPGALVLRDMA
ncbi:hypothetical protein ARMSODRAFT_313783 [Armillaria solidipes]|uniref:RRM domain-containing protein n=1 Tax=Armillaria solidipes TaxID=1076256 RepID=A0A2H3B9L5_9AGAR|nr:hypothetical protein ARMSODRAFT_313783 [Armillaria solidipes]